MKRLLLFFFITITLNSNAQGDSLFYHKMDSLATEMFVTQAKKDSLNQVITDRFSRLSEQQSAKIKRERRKALILSIGLIIAIVTISIIQ